MIISRSIKKTRKIINQAKEKRKIVGFVPTMGALHLGHLSLIRQAKKDTDFVVVSIFVNPIQFAPGEDYRSYPRDFKKDSQLLRKEGVDLVFYPTPEIMYPQDFSTYVEETFLSKPLCGKRRPGHFRGVCVVVTKLFNIIQPDISYFGAKDYQQAQVIKKMVRDLNFPLKIKICPTVREPDGLAMSSRNSYLTPKEREEATCLYQSLLLARRLIKKGEKDAEKIKKTMKKLILKKASSPKIDYIEIVDPDSLRKVSLINKRVLVAVAVYIGKARLIDNMII